MTTSSPQNNNNYMDLYSVYIPSIKKKHGIETIGSVFFDLRVGKVTRVDFVPIKDAPEDTKYKSAFVYFTKLYSGLIRNIIIDEIEHKGKYNLNLDANIGVSSHHISEYWMLLKNKAPFQETTLNIHQLSHNMALMEEKMLKMEEKMSLLEEKTSLLEDRNTILEEETNNLRKQIYCLAAKFDNNVFPTLEDMNTELYETNNKIGRLQRTSSKLIGQIFMEPIRTEMNNDLKYGIPYSKRMLISDTDYGDSDNERIDNASTSVSVKPISDNRKKKTRCVVQTISTENLPWSCEFCRKTAEELKIGTMCSILYEITNDTTMYKYRFCSNDCIDKFENSEMMYNTYL